MDGYIVTRAAHVSEGYPENVNQFQKVEKHNTPASLLIKIQFKKMKSIKNKIMLFATLPIIIMTLSSCVKTKDYDCECTYAARS